MFVIRYSVHWTNEKNDSYCKVLKGCMATVKLTFNFGKIMKIYSKMKHCKH